MGMLGKDPLQGMPWGQQPVPGGHHNPCLSFPNREMLAGCLGTPVSPGSTTALGQPPVTSLLAQNIHPQQHVAAKKNYGGSGGGEEPAGFGHKPQHPRLAAQGLLQEPSIPLGPASSTRPCQVGFMRCGAVQQQSSCGIHPQHTWPQIPALNSQELGMLRCLWLWKALGTALLQDEPAIPEGIAQVSLGKVILQIPAGKAPLRVSWGNKGFCRK